MQMNRLVERVLDVRGRASEGGLKLPEARQLAATTAVEAAALGRRPLAVDRIPSAIEQQNRGLGSGDYANGRSKRANEPAVFRQTYDVQEVVRRPGCVVGQGARRVLPLPARQHEVRERGEVAADELRRPQPASAPAGQGQDARETVLAPGDVYLEPPAAARGVAPPRAHPGVQQERARAGHRANKLIPAGRQRGKPRPRRDRLDAHAAHVRAPRRGLRARASCRPYRTAW
jgi:hypothetical protein